MQKLQGFLRWTDNGWVVDYQIKNGCLETLPLHPDSEKHYLYEDDDKGIEVKFVIVKENIDTGALEAPYINVEYAKVIIPTSKRFSEDDMWEIFVRGMGAVKTEELGLISAKEVFDKYINNIIK